MLTRCIHILARPPPEVKAKYLWSQALRAARGVDPLAGTGILRHPPSSRQETPKRPETTLLVAQLQATPLG